jgi:hypothetical protein
VLAQQRELQMKRRQQAMSGNSAMMRSNEGSLTDHTPAMRQFGPRDAINDDPYNTRLYTHMYIVTFKSSVFFLFEC